MRHLRETGVDLVLLDLLLPDIDGITLLERVLSFRPEQRVMVLSALSNVDAKVRCFESGAADYLAKPFALDELLARVGAQLRRRDHGTAGRYLESGRLRLDTQRRVAALGDSLVALSTREYQLLEHLLLHTGDVCTRSDLLRDVWGLGFDPRTNIVDVYIRRLRNKLPGCRIETIRNVGYSLLDS